MRRRWKVMAVLAVLTLIGAWLLSRPSPAQLDLMNTRRSLRQEGLKLELSEFDLSLPPELSRRAALLARTTHAELTNRMRPELAFGNLRGFPASIIPLNDTTAIPVWRLKDLRSYQDTELWPELRATLSKNGDRFRAAREAVVSGPIRFEPIGSRSPNPLLPYLSDLRELATTFGAFTALALHDGDLGGAWSNLFAVTCLATAYDPEPIDISYLCRFAYVGIAFDSTWNALQAPGWTDAQLAELQNRWKSLDLWTNLPDTAAYSRASTAAACQAERGESSGSGLSIQDAVRHPRSLWHFLAGHWNQVRYRLRGSYEDEKALLLHFRDRELELRRAMRATTWAEMRQLPGVTNVTTFTSKGYSRMASMMNLRQMTLGLQARGISLLGRAAEAETQRRLVVAALAIERYRTRHGSYPEHLANLVPEVIETVPVDFMDGQPLRYRPGDDGHFLLYSVGLDCVDNGGTMWRLNTRRRPWERSLTELSSRTETDLAWARPASAAEIERSELEQKRAKEARAKEAEDAQAKAWWNITTRRQSNVERALAATPVTITNEPVHQGRRLSEILCNRPGTNKPTLFELLTLKEVITGAEPERATFELPIRYDTLTNVGELVLCIDRWGPDDEQGWAVGHCECIRASNGNCHLVWNTIYEVPGKHALQAGLDLEESDDESDQALCGRMTPFLVTNLCQFTPESATFSRERGAKFYGRLAESNGTYQIDIKSPGGELLRTITGDTTNGFIEARWDLRDNHGRRCTNDSYDSVFRITLPHSGRSQTLRGP